MAPTDAQINELRARLLVINRYLASLSGTTHAEGWLVLADQLRAANALALALYRATPEGWEEPPP